MRQRPLRLAGPATAWAWALALGAGFGIGLAPPVRAAAPLLPEIRTNAANEVPRCVTPARLMKFLETRNTRLDPRFKEIAHWYRHYGQAWRVRWDYAFFQMALETNFLTYRRPDGKMGDVDPRQNNFAGIGTTGGGVPGDRFPDVKTGVLGQIQHLVAYSGERLASPAAPRTALKQDDIIEASARLRRPVRFSDLARRWAVDPKYGASIAWVAAEFRSQQCPNPDQVPPEEIAAAKPKPKPSKPVQTAAVTKPKPPAPVPLPMVTPAAAAPAVGATAPAAPIRCAIRTASYGGEKTILIRHDKAEGTELTALTVLDGFEKSMTESYIRTRAPGGAPVGEFSDKNAALVHARQLCPPT